MGYIVKTKIIQCETAGQLVSKITIEGPSPTYPYFKNFIYRGVGIGEGEKEHKLIPSALRESNFTILDRLTNRRPSSPSSLQGTDIDRGKEKEWIQARYESIVLENFFKHADSLGLPMPEVSTNMRLILEKPVSDGSAYFSQLHPYNTAKYPPIWPPDELLPLVGQAQHYGLLTRLLDWSRDPMVALYFAAQNALINLKKEYDYDETHQKGNVSIENKPCIAVWVMNWEYLKEEQSLVRTENHKKEKVTEFQILAALRVVTAPTHTNPNLRAQQGVFTVWRPVLVQGSRQAVDRRTLDEIVKAEYEKIPLNEKRTPILTKFTLPFTEVLNLWRILQRNGINQAKLFPDFSGAANAVRELSAYHDIEHYFQK